ncbi:hypothetical protein EFY79_18685 [Hanamia caeni]|uniref:Uncharacterized protein n=2 Tax=Hanamia caeni TaxID=2294116 RepID=A0A3M9N6P2_9BACT|nr:hypothetical protein EFY79_18685 [Hanamia caeni]
MGFPKVSTFPKNKKYKHMKKAISNFAISFILLIAGTNISFAQTDSSVQITSQPQDASVTTKDRRGNPSTKNIQHYF